LTDFPYTQAELTLYHLDLTYQNGDYRILKVMPP